MAKSEIERYEDEKLINKLEKENEDLKDRLKNEPGLTKQEKREIKSQISKNEEIIFKKKHPVLCGLGFIGEILIAICDIFS